MKGETLINKNLIKAASMLRAAESIKDIKRKIAAIEIAKMFLEKAEIKLKPYMEDTQ